MNFKVYLFVLVFGLYTFTSASAWAEETNTDLYSSGDSGQTNTSNIEVQLLRATTALASNATTDESTIGDAEGIFNGHRYVVVWEDTTWMQAKSNCEQMGGYLVTIGSADENLFVKNLAFSCAPSGPDIFEANIWLGLTDGENEGEFKWITAEPLEYTNWQSGEPNNLYSSEDYGMMWASGNWNDIEYDGWKHLGMNRFMGYVCEFGGISLTCDSNNDGIIDDNDEKIEEDSPGMIVIANNNNDDESEEPANEKEIDNTNSRIDGENDRLDFKSIFLSVPENLEETDTVVLVKSGTGKIRIFIDNGGDGEEILAPDATESKDLRLALDENSNTLWLLVEGVEDGEVKLELHVGDIDPDIITITVVKMEFVVPDESYMAETPNYDAIPIATNIVGVSDPRPTVVINPVTVSAPEDGQEFVTINLSGFVKDPIADNIPRGTNADIATVKGYVDGQLANSVNLVSGNDVGSGFWRRHPYKGTFTNLTVNIPATEGAHKIVVETTENIAGNKGYSEISVNFSKRAIPSPTGNEENCTQSTVNIFAQPFDVSKQDQIRYWQGDRDVSASDSTLWEVMPSDPPVFNGGSWKELLKWLKEYAKWLAAAARMQLRPTFIGIINNLNTEIELLESPEFTNRVESVRARIVYTLNGVKVSNTILLTETSATSNRFSAVIGEPRSGSIDANIFITANLTNEENESMQYFYGRRKALPGDIVAQEKGGSDSLVFDATSSDISTSIKITAIKSNGEWIIPSDGAYEFLSQEAESIKANVMHKFSDGAEITLFGLEFTETDVNSHIFRTEINNSQRYSWTAITENIYSSGSGLYLPFNIRVKGLEDYSDFKINLFNKDFVLREHSDNYWYIEDKDKIAHQVYVYDWANDGKVSGIIDPEGEALKVVLDSGHVTASAGSDIMRFCERKTKIQEPKINFKDIDSLIFQGPVLENDKVIVHIENKVDYDFTTDIALWWSNIPTFPERICSLEWKKNGTATPRTEWILECMHEQNEASLAYIQAKQFERILQLEGLQNASAFLTFGEDLRQEGLEIIECLGYEQEVYFTAFGAAGAVAAGMVVDEIRMGFAKFQLKYLKPLPNTQGLAGKGKWRSPAKLIYEVREYSDNNAIENAIVHILRRHGEEAPVDASKFIIKNNEILPLLDESVYKIQSLNITPRINENGYFEYRIPMKKIGTENQNKLLLVTESKINPFKETPVVTAYPIH